MFDYRPSDLAHELGRLQGATTDGSIEMLSHISPITSFLVGEMVGLNIAYLEIKDLMPMRTIKLLALLGLALFLPFSTWAQKKLPSEKKLKKKNYQEVRIGPTPTYDELDTSVVVERLPMYPDGLEGLQNFIRKETKYPKKARKERIEGLVLLNFTVQRDGTIDEIEVIKGAHPLLEEEAIRVVQEMEQWYPATQRGKAVPVQLNLPFNFKL